MTLVPNSFQTFHPLSQQQFNLRSGQLLGGVPFMMDKQGYELFALTTGERSWRLRLLSDPLLGAVRISVSAVSIDHALQHTCTFLPQLCDHYLICRMCSQRGRKGFSPSFLFNHPTRGLKKSLCNFTGSLFEQCENPIQCHGSVMVPENCHGLWEQSWFLRTIWAKRVDGGTNEMQCDEQQVCSPSAWKEAPCSLLYCKREF